MDLAVITAQQVAELFILIGLGALVSSFFNRSMVARSRAMSKINSPSMF